MSAVLFEHDILRNETWLPYNKFVNWVLDTYSITEWNDWTIVMSAINSELSAYGATARLFPRGHRTSNQLVTFENQHNYIMFKLKWDV